MGSNISYTLFTHFQCIQGIHIKQNQRKERREKKMKNRKYKEIIYTYMYIII